MAKRVYTRIGDVFSIKCNEQEMRYFQFVARDNTQLDSDVIRIFHKSYSIGDSPKLSEIIDDDVDAYVHVLIDVGVKLDYWEKVGHVKDVGELDVLFRDTDDYGTKLGEEPVRVSSKWWVWKIDGEEKYVGRLKGKYRDAYVGVVVTPEDVLELLRGNKYPPFYPDFE